MFGSKVAKVEAVEVVVVGVCDERKEEWKKRKVEEQKGGRTERRKNKRMKEGKKGEIGVEKKGRVMQKVKQKKGTKKCKNCDTRGQGEKEEKI